MKKSTKKCLILSIVIALVVLTMACVSAAGENQIPATSYCPTCLTYQPAEAGDYHPAQCNDGAYTDIICSVCNEKGVITICGETPRTQALGHIFDNELFEYKLSSDGTYFHKLLKCSRNGCTETKIEGEPGEIVKYCEVNFINNFVTETYEDEKVYHTTLAKTYKTEVTTKYVAFPAKGTTDVETPKDPVRIADVTFGKYIFAGWLSEEELIETANKQTFAASLDDTAEILKDNRYFDNEKQAFIYDETSPYAPIVEAAKASDPAVGVYLQTPAVYNFYAIFEVNTSYEHEIIFLNYDGSELYKTKAPHALSNVDYRGETPVRPRNAEYTYEFINWAIYNNGTPLGNKKNYIPPVYGDLKVQAQFDSILRNYYFKYYHYVNGKLTAFFPESDFDDVVTLAGTGSNRLGATVGLGIDVPVTYTPQYQKEHKGDMWVIPSRGDFIVDLTKIKLPEGTPEKTVIALVPYYQNYERYYKLPVSVIYADDDSSFYHPEDITIEVKNANGVGIGYAEINQSGKYYKDGTYQIDFTVPYSSRYYVSASSTGYSGSKETKFFENDPGPEDDHPGNIIIILTRDVNGPCNCLCHSFIKPVWVGILNLLNSLFGAEYVCCDDMFANIGPQLNYGPASNK